MRKLMRPAGLWCTGLLLLVAGNVPASEIQPPKLPLPAANAEQLEPSIHPLQPADHSASVNNKSKVMNSSRGKVAAVHAAASGKVAKHARKPVAPASSHADELGPVQGLVKAMLDANQRYMKSKPAAYFERFASKQTPRATVVTCSDSRVQTNAFHGDAVNDLFVVRDIGNQLATAEGSIEYGVRHLHTPLLMFIGHSVCGAIEAASGDFSNLEPAIRKELLTINIPKGIAVNDGVLINVNNQVEAALLKFGGEVDAGKLAVIGAFYDFRNDYKQGRGKLIITNINGETEPGKLAALTKAGNFFMGAGSVTGTVASH
ncbi:carbonic anhydrase [Vogesella sp. LIG4]|uniref:carbonic anhydrase n=1 Tax=Vogesella sp. LIG4 TaxID=1192162 RepID=UPI001E520505|nr:carbonic anhydrase [Vogesella sp. LIG4]